MQADCWSRQTLQLLACWASAPLVEPDSPSSTTAAIAAARMTVSSLFAGPFGHPCKPQTAGHLLALNPSISEVAVGKVHFVAEYPADKGVADLLGAQSPEAFLAG
jgi:hypothetical protein